VAVTLQVKVKSRAKRSAFLQQSDGSWVAQLRSPPVDGKANEELLALVAEHFHCRKSAVFIKSGASSRVKLISVEVQ
jgi:uncharacterized protein (TIGR00251 family)